MKEEYEMLQANIYPYHSCKIYTKPNIDGKYKKDIRIEYINTRGKWSVLKHNKRSMYFKLPYKAKETILNGIKAYI